jgi:hypothetical protein
LTFLNSLGVIGFLSLPVILILHLLREPARRLVVSHLKLWAFLEHEAKGPRVRSLPVTRILLVDLWIAVLLTLAWIQPIWSVRLPLAPARQIVILIDTTTSMRANLGSGTRFSEAQIQAKRIIADARSRDVVTVIKFGRIAEVVADSRDSKSDQLTAAVDALQAGGAGDALHEALFLGRTLLKPELAPQFHIITDGNLGWKDASDLEGFSFPVAWHFIGDSLDNQAITELNVQQTSANEYQLFTRFANFSEREALRTAVLEIDGKPAAQAEVKIAPNSTVAQVWRVTPGAVEPPRELRVAFQGEDGLAGDDSASLGLLPGNRPRVALVADDSYPLQQAIQAVGFVDLQLFTVDDYLNRAAPGEPDRFDLTVFRGFMPTDLPEGLILFVEPPADSSLPSLAAGSSQAVAANALTHIPKRHPITNGIDFNSVRWGRVYELTNPHPGLETLLAANDAPILLYGQVQAQASQPRPVVVLLADLARGNFAQHPAFPMLIANLVDYSRNSALPQTIKTGEPLALPPLKAYQALQLLPPDKPVVQWDDQWPAEWDLTQDPGFYRFKMLKFDGDVEEFSTGANAGDLLESDLRTPDWVVSVQSTAPGGFIPPNEQEKAQIDLRPWLLGIALLLLVLEASLAWRR